MRTAAGAVQTLVDINTVFAIASKFISTLTRAVITAFFFVTLLLTATIIGRTLFYIDTRLAIIVKSEALITRALVTSVNVFEIELSTVMLNFKI